MQKTGAAITTDDPHPRRSMKTDHATPAATPREFPLAHGRVSKSKLHGVASTLACPRTKKSRLWP